MPYGNQARKIELWKKFPYCFWCGRLTTFSTDEIAHPPDSMATVDHIRSCVKTNIEFRSRISKSKTVLACFRCNHIRSKYESLFWDEICNSSSEIEKIEIRRYNKSIVLLLDKLLSTSSTLWEELLSTSQGRRILKKLRTVKKLIKHDSHSQRREINQRTNR